MASDMLTVKDLRVSVEDSEILHGVDISIGPGETHVLMGPNGAGKSTLGNALMGNPQYTVTGGEVRFHGEDLLEKSVNERAASGLFMSFQNPIEIPGISLENFMRSAIEQRSGTKLRLWDFRKQVRATLDTLQMEHSYAERDLNVGFSGGEKKKAEILQLLLLKPSLAILDETDSGLDVDAVKTVSRGIKEFQKDQEASLLVITHNAAILDALHVDKVHVLVNGRIVKEGGAELIKEIEENGFS
ncbi:MAG: Fe-S cluster assembly ATPase SufC, partial [Oscillospiraceae bacterium]|nr:Fe-S cluster assembly ATPase SufC [Oscillospiraceae bacterium]